MPQFDPTYIYSQVFWLIVSFTILYLLMSRLIIPRVSTALEERVMTVEKDIEQARKIREEAESILEKYKTGIAETVKQSQKIMQESYEKSIVKAEEKKKDIQAELEVVVAQAEAEIGELKAQLIKDIEKSEVELVQSIIKTIPGVSATQKEIDSALNKVRETVLH